MTCTPIPEMPVPPLFTVDESKGELLVPVIQVGLGVGRFYTAIAGLLNRTRVSVDKTASVRVTWFRAS